LVDDAAASKGAYVTIRAGLNNTNAAPTDPFGTDPAGMLVTGFTGIRSGTYYLFGRVNGPSADDDSIYVSFDSGEFAVANGLGTVGWQWVPIARAELRAGDHSITIAYREDGLKIDKLNITTFEYGPTELGEDGPVRNCGP
jgi:hypothetical protein